MKKPRAMARGSLLDNFRGRSVLGYDRGLALAPVEPVIDAQPDGLDPLLGIEGQVAGLGAIQSCYALRAEIVVIEFSEYRPVRRNRIFEAAADGPAGSSLRELEGGAKGLAEILIEKRPSLANLGAAAPDVEQGSGEPAGEANACGDARQPVRPHVEAGSLGTTSTTLEIKGVAGHARTREIALNAQ